jgi:RNA polymerase sigma factor (TIGR02999 family)
MARSVDVSLLLERSSAGDRDALDELTVLVLAELRSLARAYMRRERRDHTLQTTALINETYLRLTKQRGEWKNRNHFLGVAAQAMRRILVDHARAKHAARHGGGAARTSVDEQTLVSAERAIELLALDEALERLAVIDQQKHRVVELRYFGGLTLEETADVMGVAPVTVVRHWRLARAWLRREVARGR